MTNNSKMSLIRIGINVVGIIIIAIPWIFGIPLIDSTIFLAIGSGLIILGRILIYFDILGLKPKNDL